MFDEERFNQIYRKYAAGVRRYCLIRLSNDESAAEEAASDVFVALYQRWDELDKDDNIGLWLIRSADLCIKRQRQKFGKYYGRIEPVNDETLCRLHDPTQSAEGELAAKELLSRIEKTLPEKYRELFRLRNIEGLSMIDAARRLGKNYATTKYQYRRLDALLEKIKRKIENDEF